MKLLLSTAIAAAALGPQCVNAFLMPVTTSITTNRATAPTTTTTRLHAAAAAKDKLLQDFPQVSSDFLTNIVPPPAEASDREKNLVRARSFATMAPRIILSRGVDVIADDFTYYSSSTGPLDRDEYMGLVAIMERAMPDLRLCPSGYEVAGDGAVLFLSQAEGTFTGELILGSTTMDGSGHKYQGKKELNVVTFNNEGRLQSYSAGLPVGEDEEEEVDEAGAAGVANEMVELQKRIDSQRVKLATIPEGNTAHEKILKDIEAAKLRLVNYVKDGEVARKVPGDGMGGLLYAMGQEVNAVVPEDLVSALAYEGVDARDYEVTLETIHDSECSAVMKTTKPSGPAAW